MSRSRAACCARAVRTGAYPPRVCRHEEKAVGKATKKVAKAVDKDDYDAVVKAVNEGNEKIIEAAAT